MYAFLLILSAAAWCYWPMLTFRQFLARGCMLDVQGLNALSDSSSLEFIDYAMTPEFDASRGEQRYRYDMQMSVHVGESTYQTPVAGYYFLDIPLAPPTFYDLLTGQRQTDPGSVLGGAFKVQYGRVEFYQETD